MTSGVSKILRRTAIGVGVLAVLAAALGAYVYSILPKAIGTPPTLQEELFRAPEHETPMARKYIFSSAAELAAMIRRGDATAEAIVDEFIAHIKNRNHTINAIVWLREAEARQEARAADEAVRRGGPLPPLLGVPVTVKEMYWVKGLPSTLNATMYGFVAPRDAAIVSQLKTSGAILLGTTNVPYMLGDYQTNGEVYPPGNNPYEPARTPGGSTGGGAAAVAAGFSTIELGSDLGGSIGVPAAFCGLYSLKATYGALNASDGTSPDTSVVYTRMAMVSPGLLARTPGDLASMWNVLRDTRIDERFQQRITWKPPTDRRLDQYRVAWIDEWPHVGGVAPVGQDVKDKLASLAAELGRAGAAVERIAPDAYDDLNGLFLRSYASMMGEGQPWVMRQLIKFDMRKMDDGSASFRVFNETIGDASDAGWQAIERDRAALIDRLEAFFRSHDFFIVPITYGPAFKKGQTGAPLPGDHGSVPYLDYVAYSYLFNATGHPTLTLPLGLNDRGLPIAVQVVGPRYSEPELLHFATVLEPFTPGFQKPREF